MLYGEIEVGDVLEWKTFGGQSTKLLVTGHGEIIKYGAKKGDDKKIIKAVYVRSLYAFDDDPELVEAGHLRQNCKRAAPEVPQSGDDDIASDDADNVTASDAKREGDDFASSETDEFSSEASDDSETVDDENQPPSTSANSDDGGIVYDDPKKNKKKSKTFQ